MYLTKRGLHRYITVRHRYNRQT